MLLGGNGVQRIEVGSDQVAAEPAIVLVVVANTPEMARVSVLAVRNEDQDVHATPLVNASGVQGDQLLQGVPEHTQQDNRGKQRIFTQTA